MSASTENASHGLGFCVTFSGIRVFRLSLDDCAREARLLEAISAWRARVLGLPYGDQGLLISRCFYETLGGYRPLALMEDVDIARRIGRQRFHHFDALAQTSALRYRRAGYFCRPARNLFCLLLYFLQDFLPIIMFLSLAILYFLDFQ